MEAALVNEGFEPAIAASGEEAITLLRSDRNNYRALITDIRLLGRIDGWKVARIAREIDPTFPVIYITGEGADRWASQGVSGSVLLEKPFAPADLMTAILQLLNRG
jgi:DNA-binding response OmpR family regulator